jgi:hypothetical protein
MGRQQEHIALVQIDTLELAAIEHKQMGVAFELVEVLLVGIVVKIGSLIGSTNDGANQVTVGPDLLIAHGRLELLRI